MTEKQTAENGRFVPGGKGGPGRPKGLPNKTTAEIKAAILAAFTILQREEGKPYALSEWAKANPDKFYPLAARLIPSEARVDSRIAMRGDVDLRRLTTAELEAIVLASEPDPVGKSEG
jgi:hypothetical protein